MQHTYIQEKTEETPNNRGDFYTPSGLHIYFQEPFHNENVDMEETIARLEIFLFHIILLSEVEMIIVGWFKEFEERQINAFYKDGALYISNLQDDNDDLYDDLVHELAHSLESPHGYMIYGDEKIKNEFLRKRKSLHDMLSTRGFRAPLSFFMDVEYNIEFDNFLYKKSWL